MLTTAPKTTKPSRRSRLRTVATTLCCWTVLLTLSASSIAHAENETWFTYHETYVDNTSRDGTSPNEKTAFLSYVYRTNCYMSGKSSFQKFIEARHFTKVGFEYIHDGYAWSQRTEQMANDELNDRAARYKRDGWKVVWVRFSYQCDD